MSSFARPVNRLRLAHFQRAQIRRFAKALPLLRIGDEKVWRAREFLAYWTPRMFAGSILDVDEATTKDKTLAYTGNHGDTPIKGNKTR